MAGTVAALLLVATIGQAGAPEKRIADAEAAPSTALITSAWAATVSKTPQPSAITTKNPRGGLARVTNVSTGDAFSAALATLETLPIKGRAPKTGYSRDAFGPVWTDDVNVEGGHNGCDTRNDILRRDLIDNTVKQGSNGCRVVSGTLIDPYTGGTIPFTRGAKTTGVVQIDHVVALGDAWQKGAQQLDQKTRQDFANDPRNLQATDGATNEQKGDSDAATWLPPNKTYRCTYVSRQVDVKSHYGLWVSQAEHDAIANLLFGCGATPPSPLSGPVAETNDGPPLALESGPEAPATGPASVEPSPPLAPSPPAPDPGPDARVVHPGAFCTPPGATGISSTGKPMLCSLTKGGKYRWTAG